MSIRGTVLQYFRRNFPNANEKTSFADDLGLDPRQVLDIGTELAERLGCYPTRSQILKCKTIGALIKLLEDTVHQVVRAIPHKPAKKNPKARATK